MARPDSELHEIPVSNWHRDEAELHLGVTFDQAARQRPDLMEPYQTRLAGSTREERMEIMRAGLRETFNARHPSRLARATEPPGYEELSD